MKKDTSSLSWKPRKMSSLLKDKVLSEIAISILSGFLFIKLCFVCVSISACGQLSQ